MIKINISSTWENMLLINRSDAVQVESLDRSHSVEITKSLDVAAAMWHVRP